MARIIIGYRNRIDDGSVTGSGSPAGLPIVNVQNPQISRIARLAGSAAWFQVDFGTATTISAVALMGTSLSATATRQIRMASNSAMNTPSHDSGTALAGVDPIYKMMVYFLPTPAADRYLRVDLVDAAALNIDIGRAFAGSIWQPLRNFEHGWEDVAEETTRVVTADSGSEWVERGVYRRGVSFVLPGVHEDERVAQVDEIRRYAGTHNDVLICRDPDSTNMGRDSIWGLLKQTFTLTGRAWRRYASNRFTIIERI